MPKRPLIILITFLLFHFQYLYSGSIDSLKAKIDTNILSEEQVNLKLKLADELSNTDIQSSLFYAHHALKEAEALNSIKCIAESKLAIGKYYDYLGVNSEALEHLKEALEIFIELDDERSVIQSIRLIGSNYYYLNEFELAKDFYSEALKHSWVINDTNLIIDGLISMGSVYGNVGELDSALSMFNHSYELSKEIGLLKKEVHSLYFIADVTLFLGNPSEALVLFHDIESRYDIAVADPRHYASMFNSITLAYLKTGNLQKAQEYSEKARIALENFPRESSKGMYYENRYAIDSLKGDFKSAHFNYIKYQEIRKNFEDDVFKEQLANYKIVYELEKKERQIETLTLDNELKDIKIKQRKIINLGSGVFILLLIVIAAQSIYSYRRTIGKNEILEEQKEELKAANEKILSQAERLHERNQKLEDLIEELRATQQQLIQAEKMASIGTLTAGIAHEINNPLNFINGGIELIKDLQDEISSKLSSQSSEELDKASAIIQEGLERAINIVKSLTTFSYSGEPKLKLYKVPEIIESTLLFLNSKITKDIQVSKDFRFNSNCLVFPELLHQVFLNILDNSIFAVSMNSGKKEIKIICDREENDIVLTIWNNGPQIKDELLSQVFDPFYTTKDPGQGTGLGLSICYKLIDEHKGDIIARNDETGVSFVIRIPYQTV